ncbi:Asp-tRNA(Asn)/Glu-tRNA(Gln) amidotransferase subunit GatB [Carboxydothermus hydrogenoformans]|uniref:Aspartyl/glutamyl-tRNA(Asn/Gln) amidotransferase subunit B n=1 Tax=Carboxydothermus hydrogenoformans (strain ATCC BAA-161 / DSM 6008 / Z-2901) TaxID=246194 RepID=GATB_CARHZ|nr:Asp-tRNA(Asn)/Glu-tRNA(Gln) amidotransferase subunit GatB [Carboxydothermus hydrogenoformans]Q3AD35.1 RecName: Full=Aspartyl/glutamyl-tRNA(Asn/Gln) amidotransferase subunit B; Short=Asp/Glu-ADT subunit B [Carboxydothermus hydrogenoformans Z-2901]ABB14382.1 glutamyl-tRNA(Gln) amidotransferase, B subunit [Carboxydothermus hydrogenoformans Z-2901]
MREYEAVIGLEVHVELKTNTKIFCNCSTEFGGDPNSHVCPVCLGLPGVLPVLNKKVVDYAIKAALALNCEVAEYCKFDRKNYYYPDLPKNYQISQYDLPLAKNGYLEIEVDGQVKRIGITRIHMEEDAGKLVHQGNLAVTPYSLVDYNRTGVPLIEIVSAPDIRTPEEARLYLEKLKAIIQYTGISDCRMEEGSLRCDANVSVRPKGQKEFGTKTEIKNMNSFKALQKALEYEIARQIEILEEGGRIIQETRMWDESRQVTLSMRSKEEAHDYRYFPEPDLPPVVIDREWLEEIRATLPELPDARKKRFVEQYGLTPYDAHVLTLTRELADYYEEAAKGYSNPKAVANWVINELLRLLNAAGKEITECPIKPEQITKMLELLDKGTISGKIAKTVFEEMFSSGKDPEVIVKEKGLVQITDLGELEAVVDKVIAANPKAVEDYKNGKEKALGFLVGQIMKETRGRANPEAVNQLLRDKLAKL